MFWLLLNEMRVELTMWVRVMSSGVQCVAVFSSLLQSVAVCCSLLQSAAV